MGSVVSGGLNSLFNPTINAQGVQISPPLLDTIKSVWNSIFPTNTDQTPAGTFTSSGTVTSNPYDSSTVGSNLPTGATPAYDSSGTYIGYNDASGNFVGTTG